MQESESDNLSVKAAKLNEVLDSNKNYYDGQMLIVDKDNQVIDYLTAIIQPWLHFESLRSFFLDKVIIDQSTPTDKYSFD